MAGRCYPEKHYMINISDRLDRVERMIERGDYFCINRGRQYGKTTMLALLKKRLEAQYVVFSISFEGMGEEAFTSGEYLSYAFLYLLNDALDYGEVPLASDEIKKLIKDSMHCAEAKIPLFKLSTLISRICMASEKPVVLFVDEVDQAGNYRAFIDFLGVLRDKYLKRPDRPTFQSVILAGVYDIKNLKLKIRSEREHQYNSPWNVAAEFDVDMDFTQTEIKQMLAEYESDHQTGMDTGQIARILYDYTSGYPFLVSRLCKIIDEKLSVTEHYLDKRNAWSKEGILESVKLLLQEPNTLFDDMRKKLSDYPDMKKMLYEFLYEGRAFLYNIDDRIQDIAEMFGYIKNAEGKVAVANRIFEMRLYNLFVLEEGMKTVIYAEAYKEKNQFISEARFSDSKISVDGLG